MENFQTKRDNIFIKSAISVVKIVALVILGYLFLKLIYADDLAQVVAGLFILIFITFPTICIIFFNKSFWEKHPKITGFWKIYRIFYVIIIVLYAIAWSVGTWHLNKIEFINSQKITLDDVMGKNLPPVPDQKLNDSTIAGIDANKNYIRDDVELKIFEKYPNSAKIRAAELQYAQALQLELTQVVDSKTLIPVMQKASHAINCIGQTGPEVSLEDSREEIIAAMSVAGDRQEEVENFVLNVDLRKTEHSNIYEKFMTGYASYPSNECDISLPSLPN